MPTQLNHRRQTVWRASLCFVSLAVFGLFAPSVWRAVSNARAAAATITVTTTDDDNTVNGNCTLREAILAANTDTAVDACTAGSGTDTIAFAIPGTGTHTIVPTSALPEITAPVIIDGTTQAGASCTTAGGLKIELNGENSGNFGLLITGGGSTVKGLVINRFQNFGVILSGNSGNTLSCNYIGTNVAGDAALGNNGFGVYLANSANNLIGGATAGERNLISGNAGNGVEIEFALSTNNRVQGNFIGTNATGTAALGNGSGIGVAESAANNLIGGTAAGEGNLVSGNHFVGVGLVSGSGNSVQGNRIGTDATGTLDLGNGDRGVFIVSSTNNLIGGTTAGARNLISGNDSEGVRLEGTGASDNHVEGNYIGLNLSGTAAIANSGLAVWVTSAPNNTIGGTAAGAGNVISGNSQSGVVIEGSAATGNKVCGNYIGTNAAGTADLGNSGMGVLLANGAANNLVGGASTAARNLISGNDSNALVIAGASNNTVQNNYIGTDVTGTLDLGNQGAGLMINSGTNNQIGGVGTGNLVSGNLVGMQILGTVATGNQVQGNYFGTTASGATALLNDGTDVAIFDGASNNLLGGTASGAGNVLPNGLTIGGGGAAGNQAQGNRIGTNAAGTAHLGNATHGIVVSDAVNTIIGGTAAGARNLIAGSSQDGIWILGSNTMGTQVLGNFIGTDITGTVDLGNGQFGVEIENAANNVIGGTAVGAGNLISGNDSWGVQLEGAAANGNLVQGNFIGTNAAGSGALPNSGGGVVIVDGASNNTIGGSVAGASNRIAFNNSFGVGIGGASTGNAIIANSIVSNGGLGIDLIGDGITANDSGDADTGPNNLQNYPVLQPVVTAGTVSGSFDSTVTNSTYPVRLDFYANTACDPSGNGEGEVYLGAISLTGPAALFSFSYTPVPGKPFITATATDANGNTSEFSRCAAPNQPPVVTPASNLAVKLGTSPSNNYVTIATISDPDLPNETHTALVNNATSATVNGITVNIGVTLNGAVFAFIGAACNATAASFTLTVTDSVGNSGTATLNVGVSANTPPSLQYGSGATTGNSLTFSPSGTPTDNGTITGYTVQGVTGTATFAGTINVNAAGVVSITDAKPAGNYTATIRATDNCGDFTDVTIPFSIICQTINLVPTASAPQAFAIVGTSYTLSLSASGGTTPYTFTQIGGTLPPGLSLQLVSGNWRLTGTPSTQGAYDFTLQATDSRGCTGSRAYTLIVYGNTATLTVTTTADEDGTNPAACSLREAITAANTNTAYGGCAAGQAKYDVIKFALPSAASYTIAPGPLPLPYVTEALLIDGSTGDPQFPRVELSGVNATQNPSPGEFPNGLSFRTALCYAKSLVINRFNRQGFGIELNNSDLSRVEDCYLGTNATGNTALGNQVGIGLVNGSDGNRIGGTVINQPNLISGNLNYGVYLNASTGNSISGNRIGTNLAGTAGVSNSDAGVAIFNTGNLSSNTISSNTIAYNTTGVLVSDSLGTANRNRITANRIFANTGLGIDLVAGPTGQLGVTPNDPGDADEGPNRLQNFPVLNPITTPGTVTGSIDTLATSASYPLFVDLFASSSCDSSGQGEGEVFLGEFLLSNAAAASNFSFTYTPIPGKPFITAVAFDAGGNTSEFSACRSDSPCPTITLTAPPLPNGALATPYSQTISASGGTGPYTFSVTAGALPAGLTLNGNTGEISGTPTALGNATFTLTVTAANGCAGTQSYSMNIGCPVITLSNLPNGMAGQPYNQTVTALPAGLTYTYTLTGTLPTGLSFNNGVLSGTPVQTGNFSFSITASAASGACSGSRNYTLSWSCPSITVTPQNLTAATFGTAYTPVQLNASGAFGGSASFSLVTGSLPQGMSLSAGGVVSGTPSAVGTFSFTVQATDSLGCVGTAVCTLTVNCGAVTFSPASLPNAPLGLPYSQQLTASGTPSAAVFNLSSGTLPAGLTLSSTGLLSGTPTGTTGSSTFTVRAAGGGCEGFKTYTLTLVCPTITLSDLPPAQSGQAYNQTIVATPSGGAYTFALDSGALPTGLSLSASGVLSGTPTGGGTFTFTIRATGFGGACAGTRTYTFTTNCPTINVRPNSLPDGTVGTAYSATLSATPATTTYAFAVTAGTLPPGLTLTGNTLSGTPTAGGSYSFTVTATGFGNCTGTQAYNVLVTSTCPTLTLNPTSLPGGTVGTAYNQTLTTSGGTGPYSYSVLSGALPNGVTLNANTGALSGTPTAAGTFIVTIKITAGACSGQRQYVISVACGVVTVNPASLPNAAVNVAYNQQLSASPVATYTFSLLTGGLPPGFNLSSAGLLSGTASGSGSYNFTVRATAGACQGTRAYTLTIGAAAAALAQLADYDGDGKADRVLWTPGTGRWSIARSSDQQVSNQSWGAAGDVTLLGDYDGDGKTDLAVFRPNTGDGATFYVKRSSDGSALVKQWGTATDVPVPGDYDGDGQTDIAVWRGSDGTWYILRSSDGAYETRAWGAAAAPYLDVPVPGDYDGDGKTDVAVFRRGNGMWLIKHSRTGNDDISIKQFGTGADTPVAHDYDGDGRTDLAVWRPSEGAWYILLSATNAPDVVAWGSSQFNDHLVPGDYDGDGKADIAVWRSADSVWYVRCSANGAMLQQRQGQPGETPVPAYGMR